MRSTDRKGRLSLEKKRRAILCLQASSLVEEPRHKCASCSTVSTRTHVLHHTHTHTHTTDALDSRYTYTQFHLITHVRKFARTNLFARKCMYGERPLCQCCLHPTTCNVIARVSQHVLSSSHGPDNMQCTVYLRLFEDDFDLKSNVS